MVQQLSDKHITFRREGRFLDKIWKVGKDMLGLRSNFND